MRIRYSAQTFLSAWESRCSYACDPFFFETASITTSNFLEATVYMKCDPSAGAQSQYTSINVFLTHGFQAPWVEVPSLNFISFRNEMDIARGSHIAFIDNQPSCNGSWDCCGGCDGEYLSVFSDYQSTFPPPFDITSIALQRCIQGSTGVARGSELNYQYVAPGEEPEPDAYYRISSAQVNMSGLIAGRRQIYFRRTGPCFDPEGYNDVQDINVGISPTFVQIRRIDNDAPCLNTQQGEFKSNFQWSQTTGAQLFFPMEQEDAEETVTECIGDQGPPCGSPGCCDQLCDPDSERRVAIGTAEKIDCMIEDLEFSPDPPWTDWYPPDPP
jgi:hypothetical protein